MPSFMQEIVALLAITNPLGAVPVFLAITGGMSPAERSGAGRRATVAVVAILGVVARSCSRRTGSAASSAIAANGSCYGSWV